MTKSNYQTLCPNRLEQQVVSLLVNGFNKKAVAALKMHGYDQTSVFERQVTRMWSILNVKSPKKIISLPDHNRCVIKSEDDQNLSLLSHMTHAFSERNSCSLPE